MAEHKFQTPFSKSPLEFKELDSFELRMLGFAKEASTEVKEMKQMCTDGVERTTSYHMKYFTQSGETVISCSIYLYNKESESFEHRMTLYLNGIRDIKTGIKGFKNVQCIPIKVRKEYSF